MQEYFFKNEYIVYCQTFFETSYHIASNFGKYKTFFIGSENFSIIIHSLPRYPSHLKKRPQPKFTVRGQGFYTK